MARSLAQGDGRGHSQHSAHLSGRQELRYWHPDAGTGDHIEHRARESAIKRPKLGRGGMGGHFLFPSVLRHGLALSLCLGLVLCATAANSTETMQIQRVKSPGGIEAWLVESHANPLIAMRFAFRGGASQDPAGKEGLAYFVSGMMDEGAGNLDSVSFHERLQTLAMRMDFDASRDVMLGNLQTLSANKDEA